MRIVFAYYIVSAITCYALMRLQARKILEESYDWDDVAEGLAWSLTPCFNTIYVLTVGLTLILGLIKKKPFTWL